MHPNVHNFGSLFAKKFEEYSQGGSFGELRLFRCLRRALLATRSGFAVEELHGAKSQVVFPAVQPWTKSAARCELADLCIIWFRIRPTPDARLTFVQAKRSLRTHSPCGGYDKTFSEAFEADSTQWYLLHHRPLLLGRHKSFQPPPDLLSGAQLPSVGAYCVFYQPQPATYSFFYASADQVNGVAGSKAGKIQVTANSGSFASMTDGLIDQKVACCPYIFGSALIGGHIGTPIGFGTGVSANDGSWRQSVRTWLGAALAGPLRRARNGTVARTFFSNFEIAAEGDGVAPPAKTIIFVQGDETSLE